MGVQGDASPWKEEVQRIGGYKSEAVGGNGKGKVLKSDPVLVPVSLADDSRQSFNVWSSGFLTRKRGRKVLGLDGGDVCKAVSTGLAQPGAW